MPRSQPHRWVVPVLVLVILDLSSAARLDAGTPPPKAKPTAEEKVRALVDKALAAKEQGAQQAAFDEIIKMDCAAVPALGKLLGDARPLPVHYLRLQNRAKDAFEAFRQYGPETVTDAAAAILNHITGQHFGSIYNGATAEERAKAVAGWREFLAKTPADRVCGATDGHTAH
jgi:hypothetical protein